MKVLRDIYEDGVLVRTEEVFTLKECTYTGKDMGERKVTATVKWPSPIDFRPNDYIELQMSDLTRVRGFLNGGTYTEKFYMYTMPTVKKVASSMSVGEAFEHTVTFFPAQYELGVTLMRDLVQAQATGIIYTGYDEFSFVGGAKALLDRIIAVLDERFGQGVWRYELSDAVNEDVNSALERHQFDFSQNTVWDALMKLNDEDGVNTSFYINDRTIYVGYKCPYVCGVDEDNVIKETPYQFKYGKTSHKPISEGEGGLFTITKGVGTKSPITRLYVYGDGRNLNRFYCADRLRSGRFVNKLMIPQFDADGKTDYIDSPEGIVKYGIREGKKVFEDIYPSLRNITYNDLRQIKYVLKLELNGRDTSKDDLQTTSKYGPLLRVQCYRVDPSEDNVGVNKLTPAYPEKKLCVCVHANGKVAKVILGRSYAEQSLIDTGKLPEDQHENKIPGAAFCVHHGTDRNKERFMNYGSYEAKYLRSQWFANIEDSMRFDADVREEAERMQINYMDDARITDVYIYDDDHPYDTQTTFSRDGYSAYCWPRINDMYTASQNAGLNVNEVIVADKIEKVDTDMRYSDGSRQQSFDIYLRDVGFDISERTPFGTMVHLVGQTFNLQFLDGYLAGLTFEALESKAGNQLYDTICCLWNEDGTSNEDTFINGADNQVNAREARDKGAIWRISVKRNEDNYEQYGTILPNTIINAQAGERIVFLNIYMPDIYVHAAENRMLKEAYKYLNENDNGDVSYTTEFDKIRLIQVPALGMQMREGALMRVYDDDLAIQTDKEVAELYGNRGSVPSRVSLYEYETESVTEREYGSVRVEDVRPKHYNTQEWEFEVELKDLNPGFHLVKESETPVSLDIELNILDVGIVRTTVAPKQYRMLIQEGKVVKVLIPVPMDFYLVNDIIWDKFHLTFNYYYDTEKRIETGRYLPANREIVCTSSELINFSAGKYYTVELEVGNSMPNRFCLAATLDKYCNSIYFPDTDQSYVDEDMEGAPAGYERHRLHFYLPEGFDESKSYYVATRVVTDGVTEYGSIRLLSVVESNVNDKSEQLMYQDLTIDQLTIKFTDNGREYSVGGLEPAMAAARGRMAMGRAGGAEPIDDKTITAVVKQKQRASAWLQMSNIVEQTAIQSEYNKQTNEANAQLARKYNRRLEALKNTIYDPDGTMNETFLQSMMLQIGASSTNYLLDNTRVFLDEYRNIRLERAQETYGYTWYLRIGRDTLRHITYTSNPTSGTWDVADSEEQECKIGVLYYIYAKCERASGWGEWVIDSQRHFVGEDPDYWYFLYGILEEGSEDGISRSITEVRGNVYVYGDNVVAGKISTQSGLSYFDLEGNEFKLGDLMQFKDNKLHIGGMTCIGGDFVMTRILRLLDNEGQETAGMSGEDSEDVAFWAGGTYQDACQQPDNVSVILTKTGVGSKIGCFRVDYDKISVETGQGKVVIDDNEGISILDNNNNTIVYITPKDIDDSSIAPGTINTSEMRFQSAKTLITNIYTGEFVGPFFYIPKSSHVTFSGIFSGNVDPQIGYTKQIDLYYEIRNESRVLKEIHLGTAIYNQSTRKYVFVPIAFSESIGITEASTCRLFMKMVTNADEENRQINIVGDTRLKIESIAYTAPKTIIGKNGFLSATNSANMFEVKYDDETGQQKILAKGLPDENQQLEPGQMYVDSSGFLKVQS